MTRALATMVLASTVFACSRPVDAAATSAAVDVGAEIPAVDVALDVGVETSAADAVADVSDAFDVPTVDVNDLVDVESADVVPVDVTEDVEDAVDVEPVVETSDSEDVLDTDIAPPCDPTTLRGAAACTGRHVGAAVNASALANDAAYATILGDEFDLVVPEVAMKWAALEPDQGAPNYAAADALVAFAATHGQTVKGHALLWHQQVPMWVNDALSPGEVASAVEAHIASLVGHYQGQIAAWDVVNEAMGEDGALRPSLFLSKLGPAYVAEAFAWAHAADPEAKLILNDYGAEGLGPKSDGLYALVSSLVAEGVPIDEVGFQMHLDATSPVYPPDFAANLARFTALGVSVNISEMDVRVAKLAGDLASRLAVQARSYRRLLSVCVAEPGCTSATFWGFTDAYTWVDAALGPDDPLLFDDALGKKPSWFAAVDSLQGLPPPPPGESLVSNGGFEDGATGWVAWGSTLGTSTDQPHSGAACGVVTNRTAEWQGPVHSVLGVVQSGDVYRLSAFVQVGGASSSAAKLTFYVKDDQGEHWTASAPFAVTDAAWTELSAYVSPTVLGTAVAMDVYVEGPAAGVDVYVDDVEVREF